MQTLPLWANLALLVVAGAATWAAGARLTAHVDALAARPGARRTLLGALLLGGITSLPEAATVTTAAALGGSSFAVGNVLGSTSANLAILAAADAIVPGKPILREVDARAVTRQAALVVIILATTGAAAVTGEPFESRVGLWAVAITALAVVSFALIGSEDGDDRDDRGAAGESVDSRQEVLRLVGAGGVILVAGYTAARAGTVISEQTGVSGGFVGFSLLAVSTSLPELSTTIAALRIGRPSLAFSNVLGTNIFNHVLLLPADVVGAGSLFATVDRTAPAAAMLAIVLVGIYLVRLTGRPRAVGGRVGPESVVIFGVYAAGTALIFGMG